MAGAREAKIQVPTCIRRLVGTSGRGLGLREREHLSEVQRRRG